MVDVAMMPPQSVWKCPTNLKILSDRGVIEPFVLRVTAQRKSPQANKKLNKPAATMADRVTGAMTETSGVLTG